MKKAPNGPPIDFRLAPLDFDLSDEGSVQGKARVGWSSDEAYNLQECLDEEDTEVDRLVVTYVKSPLVGGWPPHQ